MYKILFVMGILISYSEVNQNQDPSSFLSHLQLKLQVPLSNPARPFIKWVGGKRRVIPEIIRSMPERFEAYYEPFIGGGALFFHLRSLNILQDNLTTIADLNLRLIRTYLAIRDDVGAVIDRLEHHRAHNSKEYFYDLRGTNIDACTKNADVAAWFIYLNKTAFNGLYRVNKRMASIALGTIQKSKYLRHRKPWPATWRCKMFGSFMGNMTALLLMLWQVTLFILIHPMFRSPVPLLSLHTQSRLWSSATGPATRLRT